MSSCSSRFRLSFAEIQRIRVNILLKNTYIFFYFNICVRFADRKVRNGDKYAVFFFQVA